MTDTRYTNLYLVERKFGGPEEGDWYYDHFTPIRSESYTPDAHRAMIEEALVENTERKPLHSVLSSGLYVVYIEDKPGEERPAVKPTYG